VGQWNGWASAVKQWWAYASSCCMLFYKTYRHVSRLEGRHAHAAPPPTRTASPAHHLSTSCAFSSTAPRHLPHSTSQRGTAFALGLRLPTFWPPVSHPTTHTRTLLHCAHSRTSIRWRGMPPAWQTRAAPPAAHFARGKGVRITPCYTLAGATNAAAGRQRIRATPFARHGHY